MDLLKRGLCTIVLVGIGFIIGRKTVEEKTVIKYVDLPPIQGEVKVPDLVPKWEGFRNPIKLIYIYKGQEEKVPKTPPEITNGGGFGEDKKEVDTLESVKRTMLDWNTTRKYSAAGFWRPTTWSGSSHEPRYWRISTLPEGGRLAGGKSPSAGRSPSRIRSGSSSTFFIL